MDPEQNAELIVPAPSRRRSLFTLPNMMETNFLVSSYKKHFSSYCDGRKEDVTQKVSPVSFASKVKLLLTRLMDRYQKLYGKIFLPTM